MTAAFTKRAQRDLRALSRADGAVIVAAIERLCMTGVGDVVKMHATAVPTWRLRVGAFRVVYTREGETMWIERIGDRRDIYRG